MVGQEEGQNNIAHQSFKRRWWQEGEHYWKLPFIADEEKLSLSDDLHFNKTPAPSLLADLCLWLRRIANVSQNIIQRCANDSSEEKAKEVFTQHVVTVLESVERLRGTDLYDGLDSP